MRWTSIDDLTGTVDELIETHERLARALGEHCRVTGDPMLAGDAAQHAWHAALWRARRPSVTGRERRAARRANDAEAEPEQLAVAYGRVLDDLIDRVERLSATIDPVTDGPTARTVDLVLADLRGQRRRPGGHGLGGP